MTSWDLAIAARTVWGEARNQGDDGMTAVAWAIANRQNAGKWYSRPTLAETCLYPYQFSCWNAADPNLQQCVRVLEADLILAYAARAVQNALDGTTTDPTSGATHYYAAGTAVPAWADPATGSIFTVQIGRHLFFRNVA